MAGFFKIALRNFIKGPTTDPYPFGETLVPDNYRGILSFDRKRCIGCSTCEHVCPTNAIRVRPCDDGSAVSFNFWFNTCTFCGNCTHFCPTGALHQSTDFHTARAQKDKYELTIDEHVAFVRCGRCDKKIKPANDYILERAYREVTEKERRKISLCPECRRMEKFERLYL